MGELQQNLLSYIKQNLIKSILSMAYIIGGIFLLIYFWYVKYFPTSIKIEDLLLVSLLSCVVGVLYIVIIILALSFPVINYQYCRKLSQFEKIIKYKYLKHYEAKPKSQSSLRNFFDNCIKSLPIQKRYNPQFSLLLLPLFIFVTLSVVYIHLLNNKIIDSNWGSLIFILLILIIVIWIFQKQFKIIFPNAKFKIIFKSTVLYTYLTQIIISGCLISISFLISYPIMTNSPELKNESSLLTIYTIVFMMSFIFINIIEQNFFKRVIINILILFVFLFITKTIHVIPSIILKEFNIAQVKVNQISIDSKGCKIINPDSNTSQCIEKDIRLVWNFGGIYVFDKPLDSNFTTFERYEIPQEFILSRQQILKISK
jgi:hypothetical protein